MNNSQSDDRLPQLVTQGETDDDSFAFEVVIIVAVVIFIALCFR